MDLLITVDRFAEIVGADEDDSYRNLEQTIRLASAIVMDYLKIDVPATWMVSPEDSPAGTGVPFVVQAAVELVASELWLNKEASRSDPLSKTVKNLLFRLRDPALA